MRPNPEAEQPGGGDQEDAARRVDAQVHRHRDQLGHRKLVAGEKAIDDDGNAEQHRHPLRCTAVGEAENVGGDDQQNATT